MRAFRKHRCASAAFVAAIALLLHVLVSSFVDSAIASAQVAGDFTNVICTSHGSSEAPPSPDRQKHSLPDCCISFCSVAATAAVAVAVPTLPSPYAREAFDLPLPAYRTPAPRYERPPLNPRAPPVIA